ncbi:ABC transporter permease [Isoptericola sp. b441]|uniref:ABC transporter permease n=1 Tax=Actinotalea lenta TaxID=3064654 RepID=A0ABT9DBN5_9CELL|nr:MULTISPECIES: ABC transporter permease [unclassified Isoptericola]MDO8106362.1 ABC transporter permease [Isoptericola sp. b441]MDO8121919.1 ABC transporter permease [Isoptericola sp. b490]
MTDQITHREMPTGTEGSEAGPPVVPREGFFAMWRRLQLGLWLAPLGILALVGVLYMYYQNLDLANAVRQTRSALQWETKLWPQMLQHVQIAFVATVVVVIVAVPLGIILTRPAFRRVGPYVVAVANSGQALPAYGLLVLFGAAMGMNRTAAMWAFVVYALLPVLRNTMVGLDQVDRSVIEAGRGMGMTRMLVLTRIELPLAVPVILAGVRVAMVLNIGMATLAFLIGGGALGVTIYSGIELNQNSVLIVGAVLVAIVALTFDWLGAVAERYLRPRGI